MLEKEDLSVGDLVRVIGPDAEIWPDIGEVTEIDDHPVLPIGVAFENEGGFYFSPDELEIVERD